MAWRSIKDKRVKLRKVPTMHRPTARQVAKEANELSASQLADTLSNKSGQEDAAWSFEDHREENGGRRAIGILRVARKADDSPTLRLHLASSPALSADEQVAIFDLFAANMRSEYEANDGKGEAYQGPGGWDPAAKKQELFDGDSRFLLVYGGDDGETTPTLLAFAMFRFDVEPCHDDDPANKRPRASKIEVLYLYELQLSAAVRSLGVGTTLMAILEALASSTKMRKVCLTVFLSNEGARRFYNKLGWHRDLISPNEDDGVAWEILSKRVGAARGVGAE